MRGTSTKRQYFGRPGVRKAPPWRLFHIPWRTFGTSSITNYKPQPIRRSVFRIATARTKNASHQIMRRSRGYECPRGGYRKGVVDVQQNNCLYQVKKNWLFFFLRHHRRILHSYILCNICYATVSRLFRDCYATVTLLLRYCSSLKAPPKAQCRDTTMSTARSENCPFSTSGVSPRTYYTRVDFRLIRTTR